MSDKTRMLFVCVENSCRSQIAEGFAKKYGGDKIEAYSAGSKPSGVVNPDAVAIMKEIGIDISGHTSKGFMDLPYQAFDYIITMGCQDTCPYFPAREKIDWQIEDPKGKGLETFRKVRDEIKEKVEALIVKVKGGNNMENMNHDEVRRAVRESYGKIAENKQEGCGCSASGCCGSPKEVTAEELSLALGYSKKDLTAVPAGANLGLGCGDPRAIASLREGETVLDLGSGAGFDCFLAARAVGEKGRVIGVDMTRAMVSKAHENAKKAGLSNIEFRLGEIENLPVADEVIDVIISNCVINLSPEKARVFQEAYRVLKPGGRLAISDIVATAELPEKVKQDLALYTACMAGASSIADLEAMLQKAGFQNIMIKPKDESRELIRNWSPGHEIEDYVVSASIEASKPAGKS